MKILNISFLRKWELNPQPVAYNRNLVLALDKINNEFNKYASITLSLLIFTIVCILRI